MTKHLFCLVAVVLAGCVSSPQWREARIDGSSQAAFDQSLRNLHAELTYSRRQMLDLALVDIAQSAVQDADEGALTDAGFRARLSGMNYDDVIALADQAGPSISSLYSAGAWNKNGAASRAGPYAQNDRNRFPAQSVVPMPSGANASWTQ